LERKQREEGEEKDDRTDTSSLRHTNLSGVV